MNAPSSRQAAWIGPGRDLCDALAAPTRFFEHGDDFLLDPDAYLHTAYFVAAEQLGVPAGDLVRLIRRRSQAPIVALFRNPADAAPLFDLGADVCLPSQADARTLSAALRAIERRSSPPPAQAWRLAVGASLLTAPGGQQLHLSPAELALTQALVEAEGRPVPRTALAQQLWGDDPAAHAPRDAALHAAVYRLRKRIEAAGVALAPIQAASRIGYAFREPAVIEP